MKSNTKSSITLPAAEVLLVNGLMKRLGARTKVEVVRRGLRLLKETTDRVALRNAYAQAAKAVRKSTVAELAELDSLSAEGLKAEGPEVR
jgi:Arc/MetJ-type ribon-helix-helix transcriptional regulator